MIQYDDERVRVAKSEVMFWLKGDLSLQKPSGTMLHRLIEAWQDDQLVSSPTNKPGFEYFDYAANYKIIFDHDFHSFVVEHDWAKVLEHNSDISDELSGEAINFRTPYDYCCFEFKISDRHVCLLVSFDEWADPAYMIHTLVQTTVGWLHTPTSGELPKRFNNLINRQFRALGIMLDAAVVQTDIIRAPEKLNRARVRRGKLPIYDYHVINLSRRSRPVTLPESIGVGERNCMRLHFRRGHWRHFETFKTWVNWTLVGDPNLGFIDKHYRA